MWAKNKQNGFTIVELLIVVVVIAILAAITIVAYNGIQNRARLAAIQSDLSTVSKILKLDQVANNNYPSTLAEANGGRGITSSQGGTLTYQYDNSSLPQTFCVTARNGSTVYKISNDSVPTVGGCTTNGVASSGLVLNLDAGNQASYSGTGTTWLDLSDNVNSFTLSNGPTYSAANGGSILFDAVDDTVDFYAPNLAGVVTVEMWAKSNSCAGAMFFGWRNYDVYCTGGAIGYNTGNSDVYGLNAAAVTALGAIGNWKHYIYEMRSDVTYTNNKIYVNGIAQALSQVSSTESVGSRHFNGGQGRISGWRSDNSYKMSQSVSVFRVYDRGLSQPEVTQNFNALRGRYGI